MNDDIEIRGGGVVAVDTRTLRHVAGLFDAAQGEIADIVHRVGSVQNLMLVEHRRAWDAVSAVSELRVRLDEVQHEATRIAGRLRAAAAVYEMVELNAEHLAAQCAGDRAAMERIDARRDALMAEFPDAMEAARSLEAERTVMWPSELVRQATALGFAGGEEIDIRGAVIGGFGLGISTLGLSVVAGAVGAGRIGRGSRLSGDPVPVTITPVRAVSGATAPPSSLAAAASRIPSGSSSRVRVERYRMPDGTRRFAVYIAGTHTMAYGGAEAWDNESNVQLYRGATSASYTATAEALAAAGARPGDVVHAFGFSQGAMIASHLALEGGYDTATLVSYGSPVDADVGDRTLSVSIRHTDDPVVALAGGGHGAAVGAPGSFIAETSYDPETGMHDAAAPAHRLEAYAGTAAAVDASGDPRVEAVHRTLASLGEATSVEVTEYAVTRADPGRRGER